MELAYGARGSAVLRSRMAQARWRELQEEEERERGREAREVGLCCEQERRERGGGRRKEGRRGRREGSHQE
eukprot:710725-Rhodomonas_salina.1